MEDLVVYGLWVFTALGLVVDQIAQGGHKIDGKLIDPFGTYQTWREVRKSRLASFLTLTAVVAIYNTHT